jgi:DNA-directed RNA polymerase subunit D
MALQLEFLELSDTRATMLISGTSPFFVNALRRTLIADVPKMAIEDVEFHLGPIRDASGKEFESIFPIFDEMVAHRIGLLPIPTDLDMFTFREKCKCGGEGCPSCRIMYKLNKMGPCTVYSGDLEPLDVPKPTARRRSSMRRRTSGPATCTPSGRPARAWATSTCPSSK